MSWSKERLLRSGINCSVQLGSGLMGQVAVFQRQEWGEERRSGVGTEGHMEEKHGLNMLLVLGPRIGIVYVAEGSDEYGTYA